MWTEILILVIGIILGSFLTISTQIIKRNIPDLYIRGSRVMDGLNIHWTKSNRNSTFTKTQQTQQNRSMDTEFRNTIRTQIPKDFIKKLNSSSTTNQLETIIIPRSEITPPPSLPPQQPIPQKSDGSDPKPQYKQPPSNNSLSPFEAALKKVITQRIQKLNKSLLIAKFEGNTTAVNQIRIFLQELNQQLASLDNNPNPTPIITH